MRNNFLQIVFVLLWAMSLPVSAEGSVQDSVTRVLIEGANHIARGDYANARLKVEAQLEQNNPIAQYIYASAIVNTGLRDNTLSANDLAAATNLFLKAARSGYVPAMRDLAHLLYFHDPVPDRNLILRWYFDAASSGDVESALFIMLTNQTYPKVSLAWAQRALLTAQIEEYKQFAQIGVDALKGKVSSQEFSEFESAATAWRPVFKRRLGKIYEQQSAAVADSLKTTPLLMYGMHHKFFGSAVNQKIGQFVKQLTGLESLYSVMLSPQIGVIGKF
jgi:hypothetical protein